MKRRSKVLLAIMGIACVGVFTAALQSTRDGLASDIEFLGALHPKIIRTDLMLSRPGRASNFVQTLDLHQPLSEVMPLLRKHFVADRGWRETQPYPRMRSFEHPTESAKFVDLYDGNFDPPAPPLSDGYRCRLSYYRTAHPWEAGWKRLRQTLGKPR
jgi:hypothetical protein